jgi:hypothetical protein
LQRDGRSVRWTIVDCGWNVGGAGLQLRGRKPGFDLQSSNQSVRAVSDYGGSALVCDSDHACRWSHYGHVRAHSSRSYKSNDRNLRSPTSWSGLEFTYQRSLHPPALPKACAATRWESVLHRTRQWYVDCKGVDLRPGHGRLDAISHDKSQPQPRLISSASSSAAQLRSPRDEFRGRSSGDIFDRDHQPLCSNPELHRRPEYVCAPRRHERRYPAKRQGLGGGWFDQ